MLSLPRIEDWPAKPYAYVPFEVGMQEMKKPAEEGFPLLFAALANQELQPAGAPFYNYRRIDMCNTLDVEAGVPVGRSGAAGDRVKFAILPAGRYAVTTHHGPYDDLYDATAMLIGWAKERGVAFDVREALDGDHFACRLEIYETDPEEEPDASKWRTTLAIRLAD